MKKKFKKLKTVLLYLFISSNLNAQWSELGGLNSLNASENIKSICTDPAGNIYAGGTFNKQNGDKYCVAKYNGNGWAELAVAGQNSLSWSLISSLCSDKDGNIYAADNSYVAKFNGTFWAEFGGGAMNSWVNTICSDKTGNIYAAGSFTKTNGKYYVAEAAANGSFTWRPFGGSNSLNANFQIISIYSDLNQTISPSTGKVYAAGSFTNLVGRRYVAATQNTGPMSYTWEELGGTNSLNANGDILSICGDKAGNIYAAGSFTNANGKYYVAKYNGTNWTELGGINSLNANGEILSLCTDDAGCIYAAGSFTNSNGKYYVAKYNGTNWSELGGLNSLNANEKIMSICSDVSGDIYAAGSFTNSNGKFYVAKFTNTPNIISFTPISATQGTTIRINGNYLNGATSVKFGGTDAKSFNVVSPNQINAVLGAGTTGIVSVVTPKGTSNLSGFTFIETPSISSFSPTIAEQGTTITINGNNLDGATNVRFGGTEAKSFNVISSNQINAVVGTGNTGMVSVVTPRGIANLAGFTFRNNTGINNFGVDGGFSVYPNPANYEINIDFPNYHANQNFYTLKISNSLGQIVYENKFPEIQAKIDVRSLKNDLYILSIYGYDRGLLLTKKILITK